MDENIWSVLEGIIYHLFEGIVGVHLPLIYAIVGKLMVGGIPKMGIGDMQNPHSI